MFSIYQYSTASTASAAYIIGGYYSGPQTTIAEYKNGQWRKYGDLAVRRHFHSTLFHDGEHIIIGGSGSAW